MLRHLLRNFQRVLVLQTNASGATTTTVRSIRVPATSRVSLFHIEQTAQRTDTASVHDDDLDMPIMPAAAPDTDSEYIVPYRIGRERDNTASALVEALRTRFRLTSTDVKRLMSEDIVHRTYRKRPLLRTLETLCLEGVTKRSFLEYPWLITMDHDRLKEKLALLRLVAVRDVNHFVPFLRLTLPRLRKLVSGLTRESDVVPHGNRIYYMSEMLQVDPCLVTKYLSKRLFVLDMPFPMLEQNLHHMINYKVKPLSILKDLWAFRYTPKAVQLRLERAKRAKKCKIMPWMVRCPEPILQRSLKLSLDELAVLGDKTSVVEYVAERLQFDVPTTRMIMAKHPKVDRVRVTKIKEVLDFLLDEAGFTPYEIANVPRILCHGLETTKQRYEQLKSYGCRPTSLVILCRSKREYEKFLKAWLESDLKMREYLRVQANTAQPDSSSSC